MEVDYPPSFLSADRKLLHQLDSRWIAALIIRLIVCVGKWVDYHSLGNHSSTPPPLPRWHGVPTWRPSSSQSMSVQLARGRLAAS
eukprot:175559-Chlamydomonas_euryale.AAC.1